jgi:hypothetical protein
MEIPGLELALRPSNDDPIIFFPLAEELLSTSQTLFLTMSFLLLRFESDDEEPEEAASDTVLHLGFLRPYLLAFTRVPWIVLLDAKETGGPTTVSGFTNPDF